MPDESQQQKHHRRQQHSQIPVVQPWAETPLTKPIHASPFPLNARWLMRPGPRLAAAQIPPLAWGYRNKDLGYFNFSLRPEPEDATSTIGVFSTKATQPRARARGLLQRRSARHPAGLRPAAGCTKPSPSWPRVSWRPSGRSRTPALQAGSALLTGSTRARARWIAAAPAGASSRGLAPCGWLYETLAILASGFLATIRSLP